MLTRAVVCPRCRRVLAVGAGLPALCLAEIPVAERQSLSPATLERHPRAHVDCVEIEVSVPPGLVGGELLAAIDRAEYAQLEALGALVSALRRVD